MSTARAVPGNTSRARQNSVQGSFPSAQSLLALADSAVVFGCLAARFFPHGGRSWLKESGSIPHLGVIYREIGLAQILLLVSAKIEKLLFRYSSQSCLSILRCCAHREVSSPLHLGRPGRSVRCIRGRHAFAGEMGVALAQVEPEAFPSVAVLPSFRRTDRGSTVVTHLVTCPGLTTSAQLATRPSFSARPRSPSRSGAAARCLCPCRARGRCRGRNARRPHGARRLAAHRSGG
jgi:hypothetical protein